MKSNWFRRVFLTIPVLLLAFAPLARAQEVEVEPNNSCFVAQSLPNASSTLTVAGSIDLPDIDFYRISAAPGSLLQIGLQGWSSGQGTLGDPLVGVMPTIVPRSSATMTIRVSA